MDKGHDIARSLKGKRKGGRIEKWVIRTFGEGTDDEFRVAYGYIYEDDRWGDGNNIRTSVVVAHHEDEKIIETLNTYYTLGEPDDSEENKSNLLHDFYV